MAVVILVSGVSPCDVPGRFEARGRCAERMCGNEEDHVLLLPVLEA